MVELSRRRILGAVIGTAGALGAVPLSGCSPQGAGGPAAGSPTGDGVASASPVLVTDTRPLTGNPVSRENRQQGSAEWRRGPAGVRPNTDRLAEVSVFASATSVAPGERLDFRVSVRNPQNCSAEIYRLGYYAGAGGRLMTRSGRLKVFPQPKAELAATGAMLSCPWQASWTLDIPQAWTSGVYLASFVTESGYRAVTPFVLRGTRASRFLVVLPFTTYQAYNMYPRDGVVGRSMYGGFVPSPTAPSVEAVTPDGKRYAAVKARNGFWTHYGARSRIATFERPYADDGFPSNFAMDQSFAYWAESQSLDVSYATGIDLHEGRVDPARHKALLFSGHDEYWSDPMRQTVDRAVRGGTGLAMFAANNAYWKIRAAKDDRGFDRMTCYREDPDPGADATGATVRWRDLPGRTRAEQALLGTQYNGIPDGRKAPLVVSESAHWFWQGCGLADGDSMPGMVSGEADGVVAGMPSPLGATEHTLLSHSPYRYHGVQEIQSTSLYRAASGAWVFGAGTFSWSPALAGAPSPLNHRIQLATSNLLSRI